MKLSVVIPTRNEAANIANAIKAFDGFKDETEIIVVDNFSNDETAKIAESLGAKVLRTGNERSAQRNAGWRAASGEKVMFVDADMIVERPTIREILDSDADALYVRERRAGDGLRARARDFERSFYDATAIDGLRVVRRELLEKTGGYDEKLVACEDWDLDRRLLGAGARVELTRGELVHNERGQTLKSLLKKKAYYAQSIERYRAKWPNDETTRRQFGFGYRYFGVFVENGKWKRFVRHPLLAFVMYFERIAVGFVYLFNRDGRAVL